MAHQQQSEAPEPFFSSIATDARADRGRRDIAINGERVTIRRMVQGIDMRLSLAVSAYRGVALCLRPGVGEALVYQIRLVHRDSDLSVVLDEALDDRDIVADWSLWARALGLTALVEREVGRFETAPGQPSGADAEGAYSRRHRALKRRPRFLTRRKIGDPLRSSVIHAEEREIIARD